MGHLVQTGLVNSRNGKLPRPNTVETRMAALRKFYSALDSVLFLIETSPGAKRDLGQGVDFYAEVRNFEITLITQALRKAGGSQIRAAALLGMNATTLNSKIKNYSITYLKPNRFNESEGRLRLAEE